MTIGLRSPNRANKILMGSPYFMKKQSESVKMQDSRATSVSSYAKSKPQPSKSNSFSLTIFS
jgi:hypothetical protein